MRPRLIASASLVLAAGLVATAVTAAQAVDDPPTTSAPDARLELSVLGTHETGQFDQSAAEIVAFDPRTDRTFVVNAQSGRLDVVDASDPETPELETSIAAGGTDAADGSTVPTGAVANSVAIRDDGLVVVAVESDVKTDPGWLVLVDGDTLEKLGAVRVGSLPDMVALTPDGSRAVVANEGEPDDDFTVDPEGSVGVVDLPSGKTVPAQSAVRTADFHAYEEGGSRTLPEGVRVFGPEVNTDFPVSANLEPEYVTVPAAGDTAYVTLQEANAIAVVDLDDASVTDLLPLGSVDHSVDGQGIDPSDRDGTSSTGTWPVRGMPMPDAVTSYTAGGSTYLVTANEGDAREWGDYVEGARVKDLGDDGFPPMCADNPAVDLAADGQLGRLNVTTASGLSDDGTCLEQLYSFGTRSFSIWTTGGEQVFDSGDAFERMVGEADERLFNSNHTETGADGRSDDKGPEPETVAVGEIGDRTYAFIGFERAGGVAVFDVTTPASSEFVTYVNNRDPSVSVEDADDPAAALAQAGDLGPESITFVDASDSPTDAPMLAVGNEVSGTTTFLAVTDLDAPTPEPTDPEPTDLAIELDSDRVRAGGTITGTLTGAAPDEELTATLNSDPIDLGAVTADGDGVADLALDLPRSAPAGDHTLVIEGESGVAEVELTVLAAAAADDTEDVSGSALPDTGSGMGVILLLVASIALAAGALILARVVATGEDQSA